MNNSSSAHDAYVPSMMSFVGLESSSQKPLWDWETNTLTPTNNSLTTTIIGNTATATAGYPYPFLTSTPFLDYPSSSPLLQSNNFPFYSPVSQYQAGLIKRDEDRSSGHIGLNLGHRTYFSSGDAVAIDRLFRRTRGLYQVSHQMPRCQAEGCKADLSGSKHYHRRHKVCEYHSKATVVIAGGMQQRFCQQCSRFHVLSEFDEAKRSCRRRLADHNRRRRKPQPQKSTESSTSKSLIGSSAGKSTAQTTPEITRDISIRGTSNANPISVISPSNLSLVSQRDSHNKRTHLRNDPALSLGGVGETGKRGFSSHTSYQHQRSLVVLSEEKSSQQQQHFSSSSPLTSFFHPHNFFCSSPNVASQPTSVDETDQSNPQSSLLHLGQSMFEMDFL